MVLIISQLQKENLMVFIVSLLILPMESPIISELFELSQLFEIMDSLSYLKMFTCDFPNPSAL